MAVFFKKEVLSDRQKQINELKTELRSCEKQMRQAEAMFEMTVDDNLIEARIYEMKSLARHHDYLIKELRRLMYGESELAVKV